ncbi:MMPL family transporter [Coriobacteriia bacterium Es71-Z0120]|uniref:efflux RND transporter permease subunit n=1 Tax=Parvivirga hydrogeniphila TaxID=2939460 RepID=UPI0022608ED7|nr:MMPL family transporter [Parvivirga hydrogeniphila]MCL4078447.1 MMPL family transporter [Parvivirga hydrogeniphila]
MSRVRNSESALLRFGRFVVRRRRQIQAVAALLVVLGAFGTMNVKVNYDLLSYLPEDLPSVEGYRILTEDFSLGNVAQVMIADADDAQVKSLVTRIESISGVESVHWVTDLAPIEQPREFLDSAVTKNYFAGDATLLQVSFTHSQNDPRTKQAVHELKRVLEGHDAAITGIQQVELSEVMARDSVRIAIAVLVLVTVVLLLTVPSVVVPVLFVGTIAASVFVNLGLSFYIGQEISYLTRVVVFAVQFAVTMDYALFLYHRFEEERQRLPEHEAMAVATAATFKSIVSAAATTVAGFLALTVMHLGFGKDMGLALARGVPIAMLAVITLLPGLLIDLRPLIERIRHRTPRFDFSRVGEAVARHAWPILGLAAVAAVFAWSAYGQVKLSYDLNQGLPKDMPSVVANDRIAKAFGRETSAYLVVEGAEDLAALDALSARLEAVPGVTRVFGYTSLVDPRLPEEFVPASAREVFFSEGRTYLTLDLAYGLDDTARLDITLDAIRSTVAGAWPHRAYLTGQPVLMRDMENVSQGDAERIDLLSIAAIFLIVAAAFRSLAVPIALVGCIELAIVANQAFEALSGGTIIFVAALAIGAIQLGATVDYAILLTTRYEEELARTGDRIRSIHTSVAESSQSVLVSASVMFAATISLALLSRVGIVSKLAELLARGAVTSFTVILLVLPAVLVIGQPLYERLSIGWPKHVKRGR